MRSSSLIQQLTCWLTCSISESLNESVSDPLHFSWLLDWQHLIRLTHGYFLLNMWISHRTKLWITCIFYFPNLLHVFSFPSNHISATQARYIADLYDHTLYIQSVTKYYTGCIQTCCQGNKQPSSPTLTTACYSRCYYGNIPGQQGKMPIYCVWPSDCCPWRVV